MNSPRWRMGALVAVLLATSGACARAQQPAARAASTPAPVPAGPRVGDMAPDFELPAATRYGLLRGPARLSDFRGQTVVLAFFPKARTKG